MQVAFPSFRNSAERSASLVNYFDDGRVTGWLAAHGDESDSPLSTLGALARRLRSQLARLLPGSMVRSQQSAWLMVDHGKPLSSITAVRAAKAVLIVPHSFIAVISRLCPLPSWLAHCAEGRAQCSYVQKQVLQPQRVPGTRAARQRQGAWALAATAAALGIVCLARPRLLSPVMCARQTSTNADKGPAPTKLIEHIILSGQRRNCRCDPRARRSRFNLDAHTCPQMVGQLGWRKSAGLRCIP